MFDTDLKEWRKIELEFARKLIDDKLVALELAPDKPFKDRDIKTTTSEWKENTYEIKHDIVSDTSGNVWFEYYCNDAPSGVYASKADYIVYKLGDKFYSIERAKLLIRLNHTNKTQVKWGDYNKSYMYLVKKDDFIKLSKEI